MKDIEVKFNECIKTILSNNKINESSLDLLVNDKDEDGCLKNISEKLEKELTLTQKLFQNGWYNKKNIKSVDNGNVSILKIKKEISTIYLLNKIGQIKNTLSAQNIYRDICSIKFIFYAMQMEENLTRYDVSNDSKEEFIKCALSRKRQIQILVDDIVKCINIAVGDKDKGKFLELYVLLKKIASYLQEQYSKQVKDDLIDYLGTEKVIEYFKQTSLKKDLNDEDLNSKIENFALIYYEILFGSLTNNQAYLQYRFKDTEDFNKTYISNKYYESMKDMLNYYNNCVADKNIDNEKLANFVGKYKSIFKVINDNEENLYNIVSQEFDTIFSYKEITSDKYIHNLQEYFFSSWFVAKRYDFGSKVDETKDKFKNFVASRYFEMAQFVYNEIELGDKNTIDFCNNDYIKPENYSKDSILNIDKLKIAFKAKLDYVLTEDNYAIKDIINKYFDGFMSMVTHDILNEYSKDHIAKNNSITPAVFTPVYNSQKDLDKDTCIDFGKEINKNLGKELGKAPSKDYYNSMYKKSSVNNETVNTSEEFSNNSKDSVFKFNSSSNSVVNLRRRKPNQ